MYSDGMEKVTIRHSKLKGKVGMKILPLQNYNVLKIGDNQRKKNKKKINLFNIF